MIKEILSKANLTKAYKQVVANKGSAGVDRMTVFELKSYLQTHWDELKTEIENGRYAPQAVRGVEIPKPNGDKRLLGIPTVLDRMLQQAIYQELNTLYDPEFSEYSFGFRHGRSALQAVSTALGYINSGFQHVIDLDLKTFFDLVNHDFLMSLLQDKIKDRTVLKIIRKYLKSGIMLKGEVTKRTSGTPQGSPLSPLLSNILLNELDKELTKRGLRFVRYADDCSIFLKSERAAKRVLQSITKFIEDKLKLKVNQEKTKICRPVNLIILGYGFVPTYKKGEKGKYQLVTSEKAFKTLKTKVKEVTRKTSPKTFDEMIRELNSVTRGWLNYFKMSSMWNKIRALDGWIKNRVRYFIWKKWKKPNRRMRAFSQLGRNQDDAYSWSRSRLGGWRIAQSPIMTTTVTDERLEKRGYQSVMKLFEKLHYC
jgi:group II intron reverse transcriptase/maturase